MISPTYFYKRRTTNNQSSRPELPSSARSGASSPSHLLRGLYHEATRVIFQLDSGLLSEAKSLTGVHHHGNLNFRGSDRILPTDDLLTNGNTGNIVIIQKEEV